MDKELLGEYGEVLASRYLREHGYIILDANYESKFGEIDLIAEDRKFVSFVEVKTRSEGMKYAPADAVDTFKRRKIISTAKLFLKDYKMKRQPRFDIIEVYFNDDKPYKINHIIDAFNEETL